jgi:ATP-dependent Clp protease ATP-binding subunit ClpX
MAVAVRNRTLELYLSSDQVVGQDKARKQLAVLLNRQWQVHQGRLTHSQGAIVAGLSGTGKSHTVRLMCQHLGLPFAEIDATRYTEAGYKGLDLRQMFLPLLQAAALMVDAERQGSAFRLDHEHREGSVLRRADIKEVVRRAETGVILLDEFDKWMLRINHVTGQKDRALQSELLKIIEGSKEYVNASDEEVGVLFDTSRVLIICAGSFIELFRQVRKRMHGDADENLMLSEAFWNQIVPEDFERFGLLPELAGRLSTHIFVRPLEKDHLTAIIKRPESALHEWRQQFEECGCRWSVNEAGILGLAARAMERQIGARAVSFVMWRYFNEALYEAALAESAVEVVFEPSMEKAVLRSLPTP